MLKVENAEVFNLEGAIRGMRNPMDSWAQSDSGYRRKCFSFDDIDYCNHDCHYDQCMCDEPEYFIGPKDLELAQKLVLAGTDHRKFMRQIFVSMDITAPIYWWKEMDTYKVATVANSTSTMHKLASRPIVMTDFSFDNGFDSIVMDNLDNTEEEYVCLAVIEMCEYLRNKYLETNDKKWWRALIQALPQGYNQKRTWTANYETLRNIYFARRNHKLSEWHTFCDEIAKLPYAKELIMVEKETN